jgi:hypothetical protein
MTIRKYGGRYWALYDDAGEMVCVCVYRKGAAEVLRRLQQLPAPQRHPRKPAHASRADVWGSSDAALALPVLSPKLTNFAKLRL